MHVVVSYDVMTSSDGGQKRLRHVAKICKNHGQRVQFSVFECQLDWAQYLVFKDQILKALDLEQDSIRFYLLGNKSDTKIEHCGVKSSRNLEKDTLFL